jgi:hypothetical protein
MAGRADGEDLIRDARPDEHVVAGELRVAAYRALGALPGGSGYAETPREFGFGGNHEVLVATDEAGNGILGTITREPPDRDSELAKDDTAALHDDRVLQDPELDFTPVSGVALRAYELTLPLPSLH